jgi:excisionase family DNA binding protein
MSKSRWPTAAEVSPGAPARGTEPRGEPGPLQPGDLLSVVQALQLLPVGRATLYRLVAEGTLPAVRVASLGSRRGRILVVRAGLEAYVEGLRARAVTRPAGRGGLALDVDALRSRILGRAVPSPAGRG